MFASDDQNTRASASVLPENIQGWSPLRLTGLISLLSKGLLGVFSSTTVQRHQFFGVLPSLQSSSCNCTWPLGRHSLDCTDLCRQRSVSAFQHTVWVYHNFSAPQKLSSDFMATVTICSYFEAQEEEICHYFHLSPFCLSCSNGGDAMILVFF